MEDIAMKKISLETQGVSTAKKKIKRKVPVVLIGIAVGIILLFVGGVLTILSPMREIESKGRALAATGRETLVAVKNQDITLAKTKLADTKGKLNEFSTSYTKISYLSSVPFVGSYVKDGTHAIAAGYAAIAAGEKAIDAIEPNAELLGLKGKSTFVSGTSVERLQMAVKTMRALTPKIGEMAQDVAIMRTELSAIDPDRYPETFQGKPVRSTLQTMLAVVDESANLFVNAQPLLIKLPDLLGDPEDKRYLVLFQNDKELRPTGGFITAYARFRLEKGKPILEKSEDIYTLDASLKKSYPAPREITTFHKGVTRLYIRDSNLSPDYKVSMDQFMDMYENAAGSEPIDGIIAVDTHVLVEFLRILGPIQIYDDTFKRNRVFSAEIEPKCDCPKAVYELEDSATRQVNFVRTDRKNIIGTLLNLIINTALGTSPSKYWGSLFQVLVSEINQKHVVMYFVDPVVQKAAEDFNLAGRIMSKSSTSAILKYTDNQAWDYIHVNNSNMAGAKSNMFVSEEIVKDTIVNADATITTNLTITYKNPYEHSDCDVKKEVAGLCLNAPLRNWVRVYVPLGSTLISSKGSINPKTSALENMTSYQDLEKTVFEGFLIVNPKGTAKLELSYTSKIKPEGKYKLLIQKQPGTDKQEWTIRLDGKDRKRMTLDSDMELSF